MPNSSNIAREHLLDLRLVRNVGADGDRAHAELLDVVADDARLVLSRGVVDDDVGAGLGKREGNSATDA